MSVVGLDIGNLNAVVSVARHGGIEVLANEYNYRVTPCVVAFAPNQRHIGEAGRSQEIANPKNTITQFKRLLGARYSHPSTQKELEKATFNHKEMDDGSVGIEITYQGQQQFFTPEQVYAMFLTKTKQVVELEIQKPVVDVVVSCPNWFNDVQRRSIIAACQMASLNCVRVLNDTTAAALSYGIYKQDLPEDEAQPRHVAFVDMGHSSLQIAICAFVKGKLIVKATACDPNIGGRDFDLALYEHMRQEFLAATKVDVDQYPRSRIRLIQGCEKLKKLMSANSGQLPLDLECLYEDFDLRSRINREKFEELCAPLLERVEGPLIRALQLAGMNPDQIDSVELIGGSMRIPAVRSRVVKVFNKEPSTTLNAEEAVSRGCALQAAILSPTFRVREFAIKDQMPYGVALSWMTAEGNDISTVPVFPQQHEVPSTKLLTFKRKADLDITALYQSPETVPGTPDMLNRFSVAGLKADSEGNPVKCKVKVRVNPNGITKVESAYIVEDVVIEVPDVPAQPMETDQPKDVAGEAMQTDEQPQENKAETPAPDSKDTSAEAMNEAPNKAPGSTTRTRTEKTTRRIELAVGTALEFSQDFLMRCQEMEANMTLADHVEVERLNAKNAVEEYVYDMRNKLSEGLADYVSEDDKENLLALLTTTENWLYEDGEDESKKVYMEKLGSMKALGDVIVRRCWEWQEVPKAEAIARKSVMLMRKVVDQYEAQEEQYNHLTQTEIDTVKSAIDQEDQWLNTKMAANAAKNASQDPAVTADEINKSREVMEVTCNPIISKPKPKPATPPPEPPKEDDKPVADEKSTQEGESMDVD